MNSRKPNDTALDIFALDVDDFDSVDATAALAAAERVRRRELASRTPLRPSSSAPLPLALVGVSGHGKEKLGEALNAFGRELRASLDDVEGGGSGQDEHDPYKISFVHNVDDVKYLRSTDAVIFVVDPTDVAAQGEIEDFARALKGIGLPRLTVFVSKLDLMADGVKADKARHEIRELLGDAGFVSGQVSMHFGSARGALRANFSGSSIWTDAFHGVVNQL